MNTSGDSARQSFSFVLRLGDEALEISGSVPAGPCSAVELMPLLLALGQAVVGAASRGLPEGAVVSCGPGCGACCRQLVPVSHTEAAFLWHHVLPGLPEPLGERIRDRIRQTATKLAASGLLEELRALPAEPDPAQRRKVGLRYFLAGIPCPFLEKESCSIHPHRPLACREYLVTSPATHCARPDHGGVEKVPIPNPPSHALIGFDAAASGAAGWRCLTEMLTATEPPPPPPVVDPLEFLRIFLDLLSGYGNLGASRDSALPPRPNAPPL